MGAPLRIAFLLPAFPERSNTFVLEQFTGLLQRGHEVDVFAWEARDYGVIDDAATAEAVRSRMRHLPIPRRRVLRALHAARHAARAGAWHPALADALNPARHGAQAWNLAQLHTALSFLRARPYDVLHVQFGNLAPGAARLVATGATDAALVVSFRGADVGKHLAAAPLRYQEAFRLGRAFLPVCEAFAQRLQGWGAPRERTFVLPSGIRVSRFPFRARQAPSDGRPLLVCVGRLTEKKGFRYALDALARLRSRGVPATLEVIGAGPLDEALREQRDALGLQRHVRFPGALSHEAVAARLQEAHLLLAPSVTAADGDVEGVPNVLKEAMATGMPVVATRHGGIPELVEDGRSGALVPERDAEALAAAAEAILASPERWPDLGRAGRARVEQRFDAERANDALVDYYREATGARSGSAPPAAVGTGDRDRKVGTRGGPAR